MSLTTFLYVGTESGIVILNYLDQKWQLSSLVLPGKQVVDIAHFNNEPELLYVATQEYGLYKIVNNGLRCEQILAVNAHSVLLDKTVPTRLWVGTTPPHIYRSLDGGKTWQNLSETFVNIPDMVDWTFPKPPYEARISILKQVPNQPEMILAGVRIGGLLRSVNGGDNWTLSDAGLDEDIYALANHPTDSTFWLAATGDGIYCSIDGGYIWQETSSNLLEAYTSAILILQSGVCFVAASHTPPGNWVENATANLYQSTDGATNWQRIQFPSFEYITTLASDAQKEDWVYMGTQSGAIYLSQDQGQNWTKIWQAGSAVNTLCTKTVLLNA